MFACNAFILTKQTITSCTVTEKFLKVNCPSHDRVCDDRIRHLNHSQQKKRYKDFFKIYFYAKTKTIVYYHLRQCLREMRLSSQNEQ